MSLLVTGVAGFIGAAVAERLLNRGEEVVGLDNLNNYYDPVLKRARLDRLQRQSGFRFYQLDLENSEGISKLFAIELPDRVVHLAAQAGVRYSLENPLAYVNSNVVGFLSILEGCRHHGIVHLVYASSSSVYGGNQQLPFSEQHAVNHPVSLYAATKKANELMAHTYSHLYGLAATGLRFIHRVRALGPAGHGADAVRLGDPGRGADPGVQPGPDEAGFHLYRRHRRGSGALPRQTGDGRGCIRSAGSGSGHGGSVPSAIQHRQQRARSPAALHHGAGAGPEPQGPPTPGADATGRCGVHGGGYLSLGGMGRIRAVHIP
jgi:NAD(P)-dependent dehydrogenase (short-subunit alcohol dehydrogenase family)